MISPFQLSPKVIGVFIVITLSTTFLSAQNLTPFVGLHGGINFSFPQVLQNYEVVTQLDGTTTDSRDYGPFYRNFGQQFGFSFFLGIKDHLAIGLLPEFNNYSYKFSSEMEFVNDQGTPVTNVEYESNQRLNYFSLPLLVQYNFRKEGWIPFIFGGGSYELLRNAQHSIDVSTTLTDAGEELNFSETNTDNYTDQYISSKFGVFGGVGIYYDFTQFRLGLDVSYRLCLNNITNEKGRFSNQVISGTTYDVSDDIKLSNAFVNLSIVFPINKIIKRGAVDCTHFKTKH